jgi:hypothetical protein
MDAAGFNDKPATVQGDLAKLPHALGPLAMRPQWCNWKWIRTAAGAWQKPPFQARDPRRHVSSTDPQT